MRILIVGASGTIGRAVVEAVSPQHEVVAVSRTSTPLRVDIADPASVRALFASVGRLDAIVSAAGAARFKALDQLTDDDLAFSLANKLMGQVNLIRHGLAALSDGGSIVVTTGILARSPSPGSAAITMVNAGLEGFVRAAALEAPRGIRVHAVSPPWVSETLSRLGRDPAGGLPAKTVAQAYLRALTDADNGSVVEPARWPARRRLLPVVRPRRSGRRTGGIERTQYGAEAAA